MAKFSFSIDDIEDIVQEGDNIVVYIKGDYKIDVPEGNSAFARELLESWNA